MTGFPLDPPLTGTTICRAADELRVVNLPLSSSSSSSSFSLSPSSASSSPVSLLDRFSFSSMLSRLPAVDPPQVAIVTSSLGLVLLQKATNCHHCRFYPCHCDIIIVITLDGITTILIGIMKP